MPRILTAAFKHETNTFSHLPTDLAAYAARSLRYGAEVPATFTGTGTEMGAFIDAAQQRGWELVHSVAGDATPSGKVTIAAFEQIVGTIEETLRTQGPFDAVLLCLHGAMVAEHVDDGEGEVLRRLRAVAGDALPIGVTLDLHANVTDAMAALATVIVSYRTYPHIDQYDTGKRCADLIARTIAGAIDPVCVVARGAMIDATVPIVEKTWAIRHPPHRAQIAANSDTPARCRSPPRSLTPVPTATQEPLFARAGRLDY